MPSIARPSSNRVRALAPALALAAALAACSGGSTSPDASILDGNNPGDTGGTTPCAGGSCPVVLQLTAGNEFTCALIMDGTVRCWGQNDRGQLGDGTTTQRTRPVAVTGLTGVTQISAGYEHTCARRSDGTAWCWGSGANGQLGITPMGDSPVPVQVSGLTTATQVSAGYAHSCAVRADGGAVCWGRGAELGRDSISSSPTPVDVANVTGATGVAAGNSQAFGNSPTSCVALAAGAVRCWGDGGQGQLGNGARDSSRVPVDVMNVLGARAVAVGTTHGCAVITDGTVHCWGSGSAGQAGPDGQDVNTAAVTVTGLAGVWVLSAGNDFNCAISTDGTAQCWGNGGSGQLGRGTIPAVGMGRLPAPAPVAGLTGVIAIAAGNAHACAFTMDGVTRCWGVNSSGQLGAGGDATNPVPSSGAPIAVLW